MDGFQEGEAGPKSWLGDICRIDLWDDIKIGNFGNHGLLFPGCSHLTSTDSIFLFARNVLYPGTNIKKSQDFWMGSEMNNCYLKY